jgi:hypothetical protein
MPNPNANVPRAWVVDEAADLCNLEIRLNRLSNANFMPQMVLWVNGIFVICACREFTEEDDSERARR